MIHIACGSTYSAALTAAGELYTWGRGNYGRLGHGGSEDQCTPMLVAALKGHKVIDVACGSGDAQTLAVTDTGKIHLGILIILVFRSIYFSFSHKNLTKIRSFFSAKNIAPDKAGFFFSQSYFSYSP